MNPRIDNLSPGITREIISEMTHLMYDPATAGVSVSFQSRASIYQDDKFLSPAGDWFVLQKPMDEIASRNFGHGLVDPITQADLSNVSAAGVALIIKAAFAALYDEAWAASTAAPTE